VDADQAGGALRFYAIGLAGYAALKVLVNAFYALDRRKTPMFVSFFAVALNLLFNWIFTFQLHWGHLGLAFSTGCVATFNFLVLYILMYRHLGGLELSRMAVLLTKTLAAGAALAAVCMASTHWFLADWPHQAFLPKVSALLATVIAGGVVFAGSGVLLRIEELNELVAMVRRRVRRGR
jgi:putative peptidoglycan lipid II flippase